MAGISNVLMASGGSLDQVLQRAIACHASGQLEEAVDLYRAVLQEAPTQPDANHNLGVIHIQEKAVAESLPFLLAALEAAPTVAQYWLSYIEALALAGRHEEAKQTLALARQHGLEGANTDELSARLYRAAR
jgi:tetratricopeptide (TPR) repeat protein